MHYYKISNISLLLPLAIESVQAGFPSPAEGYLEERIDLADIIVTNKACTYCVKVKGSSMVDYNINEGDILVVDKSIEPTHGKIVIAVIDGEFTVKTLHLDNELVKLVPGNSQYPVITLKEGQELNIWGVVTYIIHKAN